MLACGILVIDVVIFTITGDAGLTAFVTPLAAIAAGIFSATH